MRDSSHLTYASRITIVQRETRQLLSKIRFLKEWMLIETRVMIEKYNIWIVFNNKKYNFFYEKKVFDIRLAMEEWTSEQALEWMKKRMNYDRICFYGIKKEKFGDTY